MTLFGFSAQTLMSVAVVSFCLGAMFILFLGGMIREGSVFNRTDIKESYMVNGEYVTKEEYEKVAGPIKDEVNVSLSKVFKKDSVPW